MTITIAEVLEAAHQNAAVSPDGVSGDVRVEFPVRRQRDEPGAFEHRQECLRDAARDARRGGEVGHARLPSFVEPRRER